MSDLAVAGLDRTRATEVLRRPVPSDSPVVLSSFGGQHLLDSQFFRLRLLGLVRMLGAGVDLELASIL